MKILPNLLTVDSDRATSLYTVVYRTFLYNPTNLKVPKKARVKRPKSMYFH